MRACRWYGDKETLSFLVDGYRSDTFWFEQVDFLRKLLMAGAYGTPIFAARLHRVSMPAQ
jgi:hypothetical protein